MPELTRRAALKALGASLAVSQVSRAWAENPTVSPMQRVSVGIVADVHQDVIHDAYARMVYFVDQMNQRKPDYVIQLGDFAVPHARNQPFLEAFNGFKGPRYHVLGNHDMDHGFSKQQTVQWWGMKARFHSFDVGGWHFIVLDGNDANPKPWSGYNRYVAEEQREWLEQDLAATSSPTLVYSHQSLEAAGGVANAQQVRDVLQQANRQAGWTKVFACLSGHHHTDYLKTINGIAYLQINSMSYAWVGGQHRRTRFRPHVEKAYPWVSYTVPYRDPLYAVLTLDPADGTMTVDGMQTEFVPPTPEEMGLPNAAGMTPTITTRKLRVNVAPNGAS